MCRNVQTTLGINLRPSLVKALTHHNFLTAPQTKNGNHFFLPTSQKIDRFIDFFLINKNLLRVRSLIRKTLTAIMKSIVLAGQVTLG